MDFALSRGKQLSRNCHLLIKRQAKLNARELLRCIEPADLVPGHDWLVAASNEGNYENC